MFSCFLHNSGCICLLRKLDFNSDPDLESNQILNNITQASSRLQIYLRSTIALIICEEVKCGSEESIYVWHIQHRPYLERVIRVSSSYYSLFTNHMQWFSGNIFATRCQSSMRFWLCHHGRGHYSPVWGLSTFRKIYRKPLHKIGELTVVLQLTFLPVFPACTEWQADNYMFTLKQEKIQLTRCSPCSY